MDLLTLPQWLTLAIILATLALLALEVLRVDVTAMLALVALVVTGVLPAEHALDGFSSDPVMAVAGALVLSAAIVQTGIADRIGDTIGRLAGQGTLRALVVLMLATAAMSAFTHHLMVTAMMVPVAIGVARGGVVPPSRYLMPVSLAASIGATLTLIGAPAFLVADHVLQRAGVADFGLFSVTPVSAVLVGVAVLYTLTLGRLVLPDRDGETPDDERFGLGRYYTEVLVQPGSPYIGMDLASFRERTERTFAVQDWLRDRRSLRPNFDSHVLAAGDVLLVRAAPDAIASLAAERGLALHAVAQYGEERDADDSELFGAERLSQLVIAPRSALGRPQPGRSRFPRALRRGRGRPVAPRRLARRPARQRAPDRRRCAGGVGRTQGAGQAAQPARVPARGAVPRSPPAPLARRLGAGGAGRRGGVLGHRPAAGAGGLRQRRDAGGADALPEPGGSLRFARAARDRVHRGGDGAGRRARPHRPVRAGRRRGRALARGPRPVLGAGAAVRRRRAADPAAVGRRHRGAAGPDRGARSPSMPRSA